MKQIVLVVLILAAALGVSRSAEAGPLTLGWSPVAGATGYDVEQSTDNGATWTIPTLTAPVVCTGTPVACTASLNTPTTGRPQYCIAAKNTGGKTRPQICIVVTDLPMNPPLPPAPPPAVDGVEASR